MLDFFALLFDSSGYPPRWRCGTWTPEQGWLHILSDLGVWSAYMAIPLVLVRKKELPFRGIFVVPRMLAMRTPEELEREVDARKAAEAELMRSTSQSRR
jgi:hypothetical protein